jgi:hypothetical protein
MNAVTVYLCAMAKMKHVLTLQGTIVVYVSQDIIFLVVPVKKLVNISLLCSIRLKLKYIMMLFLQNQTFRFRNLSYIFITKQ